MILRVAFVAIIVGGAIWLVGQSIFPRRPSRREERIRERVLGVVPPDEPCTIGTIVQRTGMHREEVYDALNTLEIDGLLDSYSTYDSGISRRYYVRPDVHR